MQSEAINQSPGTPPEKPGNPLEQIVALDRQSPYRSYQAWFRIPGDDRKQLLQGCLRTVAQIDTDVHRLLNDRELADSDRFILANFEFLSSHAAAKVVLPDPNNPATNEEDRDDYNDQEA